MLVRYFGHSCFSVYFNGKHLLFDPFISGNELAKDIQIEDIKADYILVSHGHSDHTLDLVRIAKATGAIVIAAYEIAVWAGNQGCQYHPMNVGGQWKFEFGKVKCTSAIHSSILPDGTYGGNPMGFVISDDTNAFYYSGDTALTLDMQLITRYKSIDFAILPIGDNFTMGTVDAIECAKMVGTKKVMGVHYDTFKLISIDEKLALKFFDKEGVRLYLPKIGEEISII